MDEQTIFGRMIDFVVMLTANWEVILSVMSVGVTAGLFIRNRQWSEAAKALAQIGHIAYSAVEEAGQEFADRRSAKPEDVAALYAHPEGPVHDVKKKVEDAVALMGATNELIPALENVIRARVDPKEDVPPVKRFWRRLLAGENLAGVALRIAGKAAAEKGLERLER